jgi:hypothetical protein
VALRGSAQQPSRVSCRAYTSTDDVEAADGAEPNPLSNNPAFTAVLQAALQRQGTEALTGGPKANEE